MKGCFFMLSVLVFALVILLLVADAVIFYVAGITVGLKKSVQSLKAKGDPCCIGEDLPKEALPMVYYEDDWATLLAAYEG